jgi:hypothetical protein
MNLREIGWNGVDISGSGQRPVVSSYEHGNEHSDSIKCWEILEYLNGWRPLKEDSISWSYTFMP